MSVMSKGPVWTVQDTQNLEQKWLKESTTKGKQTRSEFAKSNLGNLGRLNVTMFDLQNYYPGTMHLAIRSAETVSIQIGMWAVGKFQSFHTPRLALAVSLFCWVIYLVTR